MAGKTEYKNTWNKENLDRISLYVSKGKKEQIRSHSAKKDGGSINAFINRAIDETMQRDTEKPGE